MTQGTDNPESQKRKRRRTNGDVTLSFKKKGGVMFVISRTTAAFKINMSNFNTSTLIVNNMTMSNI
jgi:hypothetical protein